MKCFQCFRPGWLTQSSPDSRQTSNTRILYGIHGCSAGGNETERCPVLRTDLQYLKRPVCQQDLDTTRTGPNLSGSSRTGRLFEPAKADGSERLPLPTQLYDREQPLSRLVETFEKVSRSGRSHLTLVRGAPGSGKSALLDEFQKPVTDRRGLFVSGRFDPRSRALPSAPLRDAFRPLLQRLHAEPEAQRLTWTRKLQQVLEGQGRFITDAIPEVALLLGEQPFLPELGPAEHRRRFHLAFREFVQVLAGPEHPLAIVLDDVQWADSATLGLLEALLAGEGVRYVNLLLSYRDTEVAPIHPFQLALDRLRERGTSVRDITLGPLAMDDLSSLVPDLPHGAHAEVAPWTRYLAPRRTQTLMRLALAQARRAREEAERTALLQSVTAALSRAMTVEQVADVVLSRMKDFVQASSAITSLLSKDGRDLLLVSCIGTPPAGVERLRVLPLDAPLPLAAAVRTGAPIWLESREDITSTFPQLHALASPGEETQAGVSLPLYFEKKVIGGIGFRLARPKRFDVLEREHLLTLASVCAQALERARLYESELVARAEAEAAIGQLSRTVRFNELFAGILGHDLRNPLASIMASAQLVLRKDESDTFARPMRRILASGERMGRMIEQLLDFTRTRIGGGLTLNLQPVDLAALCGQALAELEETHPQWTFQLESTGDVMGQWDRDRLLQVVSNLAGNGVKHGSPGEPLRVRMDGSSAESVVLEVRNKGTVAPELLPVLFDPFHGSHQKRDSSEGLGLGLYITQQIVLAHGGAIEVQSSEPEGTRFIVQLPRLPTPGTRPAFSPAARRK